MPTAMFAFASAPLLASEVLNDGNAARDYVLAACLKDRYPGTPLATEAELWAQGLIERSSLSFDVIADLARFAKTAAPPISSSKDGTLMPFSSCMKLYESKALREYLRKRLRR